MYRTIAENTGLGLKISNRKNIYLRFLKHKEGRNHEFSIERPEHKILIFSTSIQIFYKCMNSRDMTAHDRQPFQHIEKEDGHQ